MKAEGEPFKNICNAAKRLVDVHDDIEVIYFMDIVVLNLMKMYNYIK